MGLADGLPEGGGVEPLGVFFDAEVVAIGVLTIDLTVDRAKERISYLPAILQFIRISAGLSEMTSPLSTVPSFNVSTSAAQIDACM